MNQTDFLDVFDNFLDDNFGLRGNMTGQYDLRNFLYENMKFLLGDSAVQKCYAGANITNITAYDDRGKLLIIRVCFKKHAKDGNVAKYYKDVDKFTDLFLDEPGPMMEDYFDFLNYRGMQYLLGGRVSRRGKCRGKEGGNGHENDNHAAVEHPGTGGPGEEDLDV